VLTAFVAIGIVFYQSNRAAVREYIRGINAAEAESSAAFLESVFYRASYAAAAIERSTVRDYLLNTDVDDETRDLIEQRALEFIRLFAEGNPEFSSIYLYSVDRDRIVTNRFGTQTARFHDTDWIDRLHMLEYTRPQLVYRAMPRFDSPTLSLIRTIEERDRLVGAVVVNLSIGRLRAVLGRDSAHVQAALYVVQDGEQVIFSGRPSDLGAAWPVEGVRADESGQTFVASASGNMFNLEYYRVGGEALFRDRMRRLRVVIFLLFAGILVAGSGVSFAVTTYAYRPIREILATIERAPRLHHHQESDSDREESDEIQFIEDTVVELVASNQSLEQRLSDRLQLLRKTHYAALQLQINPHFLYNTLESIYWESADDFGIASAVPRSVAALTRFLRVVLATDSMAIALRDEVELTRLYAQLLRLRFRDLVTVEFVVPDELKGTLVPKLCLQPLVENAFYHGVKPARRAGLVVVQAQRENDSVTLSVRDNGVGLSNASLALVRDSLCSDEPDASDHVGLRNIAERLRILYGTSHRVEIENVESGGVRVSISVPLASHDQQLDKIAQLM
jgi:two-component system sensor histidine kinase YesM